MVIVSGNWRVAIIGSIVSLVIFLILYFTVIQSDNNTANQAIKAGLQQTQQALKQSQSQVNQAVKQAQSSGLPASAAAQATSASKAATSTLSNAQKLASCVANAGTDVSAITACQAKYQG